jgi:DNA polymerase III subunit delta'
MGFGDFPEQQDAIEVLKRSLARGRLAHAYLFSGDDLNELEAVARTLAKTLNCARTKSSKEPPSDSCDECASCRKIDQDNHPDVFWLRPESKSRVITIEQVRDLMHSIQLKPTQAEYKVGVIAAADRLNVQAANAFLKTLEEPPQKSILILLSSEPQRLLETILSRCLRLNFGGEMVRRVDPAFLGWLETFAEVAVARPDGLLGRYRLLSALMRRLGELKNGVAEQLTHRSPLDRYDDLEPQLRDKWEEELAASIEAEYRHQRAGILTGLHWWLRDIWLVTLKMGTAILFYPQLAGKTQTVAQRIPTERAMENLQVIEQTQQLLNSNVQEALALEVGLLKLKL